jgi:hypothetical protein
LVLFVVRTAVRLLTERVPSTWMQALGAAVFEAGWISSE